MIRSRLTRDLVCAAALLSYSQGQTPSPPQPSKFPFAQKLTYRIEWRLVTAGTANLEYAQSGPNAWAINLDLESAGIVNRLYRVLDKYKVTSDQHFCANSATLDAQEGKRHNQERLNFDNSAHKLQFDEHDLVKNITKREELPIAPCTHEVAGALASLGQMELQPGKSTTVPVTNGKKMVHAKVEALAKETVNIDGKTYQTIRYEAFLFDNVLYKRKGRLFLWITDDAERTPVQFEIQLGFPIGTISLELEKQQRS